MQTAVPAGTAVFRGKWKRTDSRFAAFGGRGELRSPFSAPNQLFELLRCSAWLIQFRQRTALSELKRSCFRFAPLTLRCRTEMFFQNIPVFRSAYSASRNARASAAFAASIKPYYGLCSKTLDLQVRSAHPPMPHRNVFSKHPGVPVGLFSDSAPTHLRCAGVPLGLFGKPKRSSSSRFAAFGGRGELRSPLHPPLPPPSGYGADSFKGSP